MSHIKDYEAKFIFVTLAALCTVNFAIETPPFTLQLHNHINTQFNNENTNIILRQIKLFYEMIAMERENTRNMVPELGWTWKVRGQNYSIRKWAQGAALLRILRLCLFLSYIKYRFHTV